MLASVQGSTAQTVPRAPPRAYVQGLFDHYARGFDEHLLKDLAYRGPEALCALLPPARRYAAALDLGCGTGLAAGALQAVAQAVDGIDLAPRMLALARARGIYRELICGDITEVLQASPQRYELVLAADVFIYVGALEAAFEAVASVLAPGGHFALTLEEGEEELTLLASSRYAHSEPYVRRCAEASRMQVVTLMRGPIREEQQQSIEGLYVLLVRD